MKFNLIIKLSVLILLIFLCSPILATAQNTNQRNAGQNVGQSAVQNIEQNAGQNTGTLRGVVTSESNNQPLHGVTVQIVQLRRSAQTDDSGAYQFTDLPIGIYTVLTHIEGFTDRTQSITIASGATAAIVDFALSLTSLREEVTVTASGQEQSVFESFQSVNVVGSTRLREQAATGIGEVLEREPGVGKRSFGPGNSRPVIRGFDGDRVLIAQDGARVNSLGFQSGDHGEPVDTLGADRVEIVKGPATLLYGSSALGGVVNVITNDDADVHQGFRGYVTGLGATVNRQGGASGGVEYGIGKVLLSFNGSAVRENDFATPLGIVRNSASRYANLNASGGYFSGKGFLIGNYIYDQRRYGIPYTAFVEENGLPGFALSALPDPGDADVDIDMRRRNARVRGGFRDVDAPITAGNFAYSYTDYKHDELEIADGAEEIGTTFTNRTSYLRGTFEQKPYRNLTGRFGFENFNRRYQTVGAEQLIDGKVKHDNFSIFGLEEIGFAKRFAVQFGGRIERNSYNPINNVYPNRSFAGFSGSAGFRANVGKGGTFVAAFTSAYRAPALEELYNFGDHVGTVTFEVGNENLRRERSNGIEFSYRQNFKRLRVDGSFFRYDIKDFVFLAFDEAGGGGGTLPLGLYSQADSRFTGADINFDFDLSKYLGAFFIGDIVNAEIKNGSVPLPRITPPRARVGLDFKYQGLSVRPEAVFVAKRAEDDIYLTETPTAGYGLLNVNGSYTFSREHYAHIFSFSAFNLTNRLYRNHLSFIKDLVPESGRGVRGSYTLRFF